MSEEPMLFFHSRTIFLVLSVLWILGGPALAALLSYVVFNTTSDLMTHPHVKVVQGKEHPAPTQPTTQAEEEDMGETLRMSFLEMSRGIFLLYGAIGLLIIPTLVLLFMEAARTPEFDPPAMGLFLTNLLNVLIVGGTIFISHTLAVVLRDRIWIRNGFIHTDHQKQS